LVAYTITCCLTLARVGIFQSLSALSAVNRGEVFLPNSATVTSRTLQQTKAVLALAFPLQTFVSRFVTAFAVYSRHIVVDNSSHVLMNLFHRLHSTYHHDRFILLSKRQVFSTSSLKKKQALLAQYGQAPLAHGRALVRQLARHPGIRLGQA